MTSAAQRLAARLGLRFRDAGLLEQALVHSSYVNEHPELELVSNERLEYLGDAVVSLVVSEALWARYPLESEGGLTTRRATIVSTRGLARIAGRLDIGSSLSVGQGAERAGEQKRGSVLAASLEALLAAIYLDQGLDAAREAFNAWAKPELDAVHGPSAPKPSKSRLQEQAVARTGRPPLYRLLSASGPDHAKHYVVEVSIGGKPLGRGEGHSRRDAETEAARAALDRLPDGGPPMDDGP
ncbi:MAG: ribonuclease III [Chloroflexi bacterium]|nr:ribonuclease III [Chloroflexota bacterium]